METINNNLNGFNYQKSLKDRNAHIVNKYIKVEKYLNRPLASLIVRAVFNTRVTPNSLTYLNFFLGLLAAAFFSRGEYFYFVLGGISIQLSSIVDSADGMLARAKNMCSDYGASLDIFLDRITDFVLIVGITVGLYTASDDISLLIVGLMTAGLLNLQVSLFYIANNYSKKETGLTGEARAFMLLSILVFSIADLLDIFIYVLCAQTVINILWRVVHFIYLGKKGSNVGES
jgi:phosphatidylglycerophosphate synthase